MLTSSSDDIVLSISKLRNRDLVLRMLIPCALWLLQNEGSSVDDYPGRSVRLTSDTVLCRSKMDDYRFAIGAYVEEKKVFSAHVTNRPERFEAGFFRNCEGHVGVMSWRRGEWEDFVVERCAKDPGGFWQLLREAADATLH